MYRIYVRYVYRYRRCLFFDLNTSSNPHVQLTYSSDSWARFQDNTLIAVTQIISTEFWILKFVPEQKWINRLIVRNIRFVCLFRYGNIQWYFCRQAKPRCWKVWKVVSNGKKTHNTGLNMRNKHGEQTITALPEGQSNTSKLIQKYMYKANTSIRDHLK